ncbi:hypothetical protein AAG906_025895 [Vitis piasezkii]
MQGVYPDRRPDTPLRASGPHIWIGFAPCRQFVPVAANLYRLPPLPPNVHVRIRCRMGEEAQSNSEDFSSEDERLDSSSLGVRKAGMTSQPNAKGEMYILNDGIDMRTKFAAMERRLDELEMKNMQQVQAISQTPLQPMPCAICLSYEHLVEESASRQATVHVPQQASNLEHAMMNLNKVMEDFVEAKNPSMLMQNDLSQKIDNLQDSISRFANLNTMQEKENSLLNLIKIPRVSMKWRLRRR